MSLKQQIRSALKEALSGLGIADIEPQIEIPQDYGHGDYSSNVALVASGKVKSDKKQAISSLGSPIDLAEQIAEVLRSQNIAGIEKIEVMKPGFVNFWISQDFLGNYLEDLLSRKHAYTSIQVDNPRFEMYEDTQPNTNKPLHIGHLRNIALGTGIVRLRKAIGHKAWSVNINNDRGIHIMKANWGYLAFGTVDKRKEISNKLEKPEKSWKDLLREWAEDKDKWETPESAEMKADHFVGKFYVLGERAEKEFSESVTLQLKEMLKAWEENDQNVRALWKQMNAWFYQGFVQTHARFAGIDLQDPQFDKEWFESDIYEAGKKIVLDNINKGLFHKREDGAIIADLKKYGLPDKVVVRSDGTSIYITQDIELARIRIQEEKADFTAYIVGNEQDLHFKQLFAICQGLGIGKNDQFLHISYGMVNLAGGMKMSSREGMAIAADDLMDSVVNKVRSQFDMKNETILEEVVIGAIKYWMLKYNPKAEITFDVAESISINGNSGPYLQYTYARTQSVLAKSEIRGTKSETISNIKYQKSKINEKMENQWKMINEKWKIEQEELLLLRMLHHFPEVIEEAAEKFSPNLLCNYLFELAAQFNLFYQKHQIIKSNQQVFRLTLTEGVGAVIKEGLQLLGIAAPSKM